MMDNEARTVVNALLYLIPTESLLNMEDVVLGLMQSPTHNRRKWAHYQRATLDEIQAEIERRSTMHLRTPADTYGMDET